MWCRLICSDAGRSKKFLSSVGAIHDVQNPKNDVFPTTSSAITIMTLEDFEKALAEGSKDDLNEHSEKSHNRSKEHRRHHHHSHHKSHHREEEDEHRHKRRRRLKEDGERPSEHHNRRHKHDRHGDPGGPTAESDDEWVEKDASKAEAVDTLQTPVEAPAELKRDSWMEAPSALDVEYKHRREAGPPETAWTKSSKEDFETKIHENELTQHHVQSPTADEATSRTTLQQEAQHEVDYLFGDEGAQWRLMKLKAVYRQAKESGKGVEEVAMDKYGDLRAFDDAREEEIELERRNTYGKGYVGKEKPSGELFEERKLTAGVRRDKASSEEEEENIEPRIQEIETQEPPARTQQIDQTALNKLKAQLMKAKLRGAPDVVILETEYNTALASFTNRRKPDVVVLGTMENRMLAGGRGGEIKGVENKRGRERGLVEENEDMSIEDMVREERRTRGQLGGEGQRFAERIAKDGKFDVSRTRLIDEYYANSYFRTILTIWTRMPISSPNEYRSQKSTSKILQSRSSRR